MRTKPCLAWPGPWEARERGMKESSSPQLQRGSEARWLIGTRHVSESAPLRATRLVFGYAKLFWQDASARGQQKYNPASSVTVPSAPCVDAKRARAVVGRGVTGDSNIHALVCATFVSEIDLRCRFQRNEIEDRHNYFAFNVERRCSIQLGTIGDAIRARGQSGTTHGIDAGDTHAGWIPTVREWCALRGRLGRVLEALRDRAGHQTVRTSAAGAVLAK